ncbi:hypothetical protein [Synechococcus sp. CS-205]|nr:hypothetical protein [Synechococcus sp. CS-205]MCT0248338.1 hypothetical protein [Synechococcus sp. CS-205]
MTRANPGSAATLIKVCAKEQIAAFDDDLQPFAPLVRWLGLALRTS